MIKYIIFLFSFLFLLVPLDLTIVPSLDYGWYMLLAPVFYIIAWVMPIFYLYRRKKLTGAFLLGLILINIVGFTIIEFLAQRYGALKNIENLERAKYYQEVRNKQK